MTRALLIIDIQNDYFPGGAFPLVGSDEAARVASRVLDSFRDAGDRVIHVFHTSLEPEAGFFRPGTPGVEIHPLMTPIDGETALEKHEPNSFLGTGLLELLHETNVTELVVVGMMSSMCVDSTVRAASELGFDVTVVADGCAAPDLTFGDTTIDGRTVHASFMAALDGSFATVTTSGHLLR